VVLTGVHIDDCIGTVSYDREKDKDPTFFLQKRIDKNYPGTGDIFASVLLGKLLDGNPLGNAAEFASGFIYEVIKDTANFETPVRDGVRIEKNLYRLVK
ncbi:MAG: bifunctional hydroxymethylpyrimidine kinase/phosphomethylpyrimidine kinase, partial [Oscillospiraceae bacterium]|nr:bifunctional hydroxymethylpyrimidine kinase/phosphomethylpyrimidine kinase [Oscillospiraceae bacterium]